MGVSGFHLLLHELLLCQQLLLQLLLLQRHQRLLLGLHSPLWRNEMMTESTVNEFELLRNPIRLKLSEVNCNTLQAARIAHLLNGIIRPAAEAPSPVRPVAAA